MNEILIHEGNRKLLPWHCFCAQFDVNAGHIVLGHNGILRSQMAMMDHSLSLRRRETNPELINNIELLQHVSSAFGLDGGQLRLSCDAF